MYWNGATLNGVYPANIVADGVALSITLVSYHDQLDFGITACRRSLPQAQRFIDYLEASLAELEQALGIRAPETRTARAAPKKASGRKRQLSPRRKNPKPAP